MKTAKRFYKSVTTAPTENGFTVLLDGRNLKTPGKLPFVTPTSKAAKLAAAEWDAQIDTIRPETMPVTRLINVAIELTPKNRPALAAEARRYAGTDLLCYRAKEPIRLAERQSQLWDPVLDWAKTRGITLETTQSVIAIEQDKDVLDAIAAYADTLSDLNLTLFVHLVAVFGSTALGMAVMENHISGRDAFELSRLDNLFQIEQWGEDEEATENAENLEREIIALCQLI